MMNNKMLLIFLILTVNLVTVAFSKDFHPECGYSPTIEFQKFAKNIGKNKFLIFLIQKLLSKLNF